VSAPDVDLLIVGGGLASQRCCETLRRLGFPGSITVLCGEPSRPYDRPPLSKGVLLGDAPERGLEFRPESWYTEQDVRLELGARATALDPGSRTVKLERAGRAAGQLRYRRLLIATGARPRSLPGLPPGGRLHELRSRSDADSLQGALRERGGRLAVIGAGLVGMEVASAARKLGLEVTLLEAAQTPLERALPPLLGAWIADLHRSNDIDVRLGRTVEHARESGQAVHLRLSDGETVEAQTVLVAAGTTPATGWLTGSGLGPRAIETDPAGRTSLPDVFAAGDVASFPDPFLGERLPSQHWEAAARQGAMVAHAILGSQPPAPVPAMFWSDQHGRRIQMVGHAPEDPSIEIEGSHEEGEPFAAWISGSRGPAAVMLVDRPGLLPGARRWIAAGQALKDPVPASIQGAVPCPT
jgi:NADPH-dependent 2,4-dienoyl-CoA reductase/sulfur reductase-like enzyme